MQTMHTATEPSEKPVQDAGVNMNLFKEGGRRPPALPPSMAGGDNANSNTETITMEFVVDPSVYRSANYQPTPKMLAALKKRGTKHKSQKTEEETTVDKKPTTAERDNGGNALSAIDIMIERLKREEQRPTPLNPHPKKWAYKKRPQRGVPKGGTEKPTIDESPGEGLQKHDERFHGGHYDGGECKYRENRGIPLEPAPPPTSSAQQSAASQPSASEVVREDTIAVDPTDESASVVSPTEAPTAVPSPAENSQAAQKTPQNAIAAPIPAVPPAQTQSASSPVESPEKVYEGIPKKKVVEYKRRMEKSRPYLDADQILSELSKIKDKKIQSDAFEWVLKGAVRLPEDLYKVQRAREMATKGKVDPLSYETPEACIADLYDSGMRDSVKPISVEELKQNPLMSNYRNHGYGIETFEVQDDEDGQALMRKVIDTHWGQDASPWCLLQGKDVYWASCFGDECGDEGGDPDVLDEDERAENRASAEKWWKRLGEQGRLDFLRQHNEPSAKDITKKLFRDEELQEFAKGKIWDAPYAAEYFAKNKIMPYDERFSGVSDDAWGYWERYSALPKRVAFKDGKLLAFMGTDGYDSVDEALRDFTSAELAGRLPMLYDEYIRQVRNAIEEGDEETAEEAREKYGEDEDEWIEHFDEWMEDSNNWWGYEDEEEILRELTPEEWWDRQDSPHKGIPMGLTTLSDSEKKKLRDTIIKRAQTNGNSLSPDELEVGKGFSRDAELMPSGTVDWSGDYIRGRDGHPGYMRLDSRGQLKEDIQADGTRRRFDFDFIKGTYLHDTVSKSPDGTETTTEYFPGGEKKSETITAPGKTAEERNWDVEGRLIYEHASGRRRRWDGATGNLIQDVDAIGIGHEWTPDGVMTYEHLPNGDMMQWDSKGNKVFERKNTPGCLMSASWNPRQLGGGLDRIAKRYNDGTSEEWEWYPGGELKSYRGKDGKLKEWSSTGRQLEFSLGEHTDDKGNKAEWGAKTLRIDPSYMDLDASVTLADGNEALLRNETRPRIGGMGEKGHLYTKNGTISWFTGDRLDVLDVIGDYHGKKFFGAFTHDSLTPIAARCSENFPMDEARHWIGETWKAKERAQKFNEPDPYAKEHSLPQGKNAEMPEWVGFPKDEKNTDSLNAPKAPGAKEAAAIVGDEAPTKSALMMAFDESPEEGLQKHDERFHGGHYDGGECKYRTDRGIPTQKKSDGQAPQKKSAEQADDVDILEVNAGGVEDIEREDTLGASEPSRGANGAPGAIVTPEQDAAYMDAVRRGDMETAERMVREAAEKAGFATEAYHGTKADFNRFNMVSDMNFGAHFGTKRAANDRTDMKSWETGDAHVGKYALRMANPLRLPDVFQSAGSLASYIFASRGEKDTGVYPNGKFHGEFDLAEGVFKDTPELDEVRAAYNAVFEGQPFKGKTGWEANPILMQAYLDYLRSLGYDSVVYKNKVEDAGEDSYLVMSSEQIKSADPVTYDDAGDVIPLSQRFNAASPDIRYSADKEKARASWSRRAKVLAQAAARMVERFMPGVKVRLSETPYEGGADERKSISGIFTGSAADYANRSRHGGVADGPSLKKIGTGEGSQVFGWGLYGSKKRDVADSYAAMAVGNKDKGVGYSKNGRVLHSEGDGVEGDAATLLALYGDIETAIKEAPAFPNGDAIVKELEEHGSEYKEYKPNEIVYEQTFFTNREQGDDSHLLMWQEPIGLKRLKAITEALPFEKQRIFRSWVRGSLPYGNKPQHAWGGDVYEALANTLDGYKSASEFLRDKLDYDGVKVPVGTFNSLHKQDGDEVGWNYVSFRDNNISVDHKWVDGEMRYFKGDGGKVVGTYNRRTGEVVLYPGADKNTIAHELGGHATWQYAEQLAKEGNDKLLNKMNQVVDAAPRNIKDEVAENYGKEADAVQREEIWAHVMGHRGSAAIQKALESKRGRSWWGRFWSTAKEAWRGLASKVGLNRTSLDNIDQMSPDEFADYMAKEMVSGKVLGNIKYDKSDNSSSDDKRKQIVGTRGARKLGIGNQSDAQQMESDGASREDIWRKTGWWKGQDGQWRIEIADIPDVFKPLSKKEATRLKALKAAEKKEDAAVKDAIMKYKAARDSGNADEANKYADEAERHEAASLKHSQARYPLEARSKGWTEDILGNLLADHPLLKAYPWLSQTKVNRVSLPEGIGGHTDSSKNVITLSDTNTDAENHSALAHEIQHLIQSVEGFAKGADPDKVGMSNYLQHGGEVESRNVEKRLTMSPEERAATPPWETEDVAESEQIVRQE